jgi:ribosomal protein S18 acetylase RimI-like enzyme
MIQYRLATPADNEQLIELTSACGMTGNTSLRIDRYPDFFRLLNMRGESRVFVATEAGDKIVGSISVSLQKVYIDGEIYPVHYVADFKVLDKYRRSGIGIRLCDQLADYMLSIDGDLVFLTVAKGNPKPFRFFKNRPHIPDFQNLGVFRVQQFIGSAKKPVHPGCTLESIPVDEEVVSFLNNHYRQYALGTVITREGLADTRILALRQKNRILGIMGLVDTMAAKQNVLMRLPNREKYLLKLLNSCSALLGMSKMPVISEPVRMIYIKYLAVNNNEKQWIRLLVNTARQIVFEKGYSFASMGLHEKDPLNHCIAGLPKLTFHSIGMFLSMKNNQSLVSRVIGGIPFEDYSLV